MDSALRIQSESRPRFPLHSPPSFLKPVRIKEVFIRSLSVVANSVEEIITLLAFTIAG
jgi:hypothetical protein